MGSIHISVTVLVLTFLLSVLILSLAKPKIVIDKGADKNTDYVKVVAYSLLFGALVSMASLLLTTSKDPEDLAWALALTFDYPYGYRRMY